MNNIKNDKYYKKYIKYKQKYLELKYGGAFDITSIIPPKLYVKIMFNIDNYIDSFLGELTKSNNVNIKNYVNDIKILIPVLSNFGSLFISNINILEKQLLPILDINVDNIATKDIEIMKTQLIGLKKVIIRLKLEKNIKPSSVIAKLITKPTLFSDFTKLKNTTLFKNLELGSIIKPIVDRISSVPFIGSKIKSYINL